MNQSVKNFTRKKVFLTVVVMRVHTLIYWTTAASYATVFRLLCCVLLKYCIKLSEYGWVGQISDDRWSAVPQSEVNVTEGDSIELSVYFLQNGPSSSDSYTFTITSTGSAACKRVMVLSITLLCTICAGILDYSMVHIQVLELTDEPVPVTILAVDDNVYEGTEVIYLRLTETNSSNDVTHGLVHPSITIILEDNDSMLFTSNPHTMQGS